MTVINTWNETNLHNTLKKIYAGEFNGQTEQKSGSFICDILTPEEIIEIQTGSVSVLKKKIEYFINQGKKIRVVHPVIEEKIIKTVTETGELLSSKKSPKSETPYASLQGLTGVYSSLKNNLFTLELIGVSITEIRIKKEEKTQIPNKSRRFLKDWIPGGKQLNKINWSKKYHTLSDYLSFLPPSLPEDFTPPELKGLIFNHPQFIHLSKSNRQKAASTYTLLLWLFCKMEIIEKTEKKKGKSWIYHLK